MRQSAEPLVATAEPKRLTMSGLSQKELTDSGMAFVLLFLLLHWFLPQGRTFPFVAIVVLVVTMASPRLLRPFAFAWLKFSELLGSVRSRLLLAAVHFGVVVPVGLIAQVLRDDPMRRKAFKRREGSLFIERRHRFTADDLKNPF